MKLSEFLEPNTLSEMKQQYRFILSESITPKPTPYGTDFNNHQWCQLQGGQWITFLKSKGELLVVIYHKGTIAFGHNYQTTDLDVDDIKDIDQLVYKYKFNTNKEHNTSALLVFNNVFYVIIKAIEHFDPILVKFGSGSGRYKLERMYKQLVNNKSFLKALDDIGYFYSGYLNYEFLFMKTEYK